MLLSVWLFSIGKDKKMKRMKNVKNKVLVLIGACIPLLNMTTVHAEGLNTGELRNWVSSYLDPLESTLLWVIPVTLGIYLLVKAIHWWSKEAEEGNEKPYWVTVKNGIIVGVIAESIDLLLSMFSIS